MKHVPQSASGHVSRPLFQSVFNKAVQSTRCLWMSIRHCGVHPCAHNCVGCVQNASAPPHLLLSSRTHVDSFCELSTSNSNLLRTGSETCFPSVGRNPCAASVTVHALNIPTGFLLRVFLLVPATLVRTVTPARHVACSSPSCFGPTPSRCCSLA